MKTHQQLKMLKILLLIVIIHLTTVRTKSSEETAVDPKDEEIQQLQLKANENEEKYLRLYAEFENYKRRIQKENETNKTYQSQRCFNGYFTND